MNMEQVIARINELARLAKTRSLTPEEEAERATLRQKYIAAFRNNLIAQLDNTYVVDKLGQKRKLSDALSEQNKMKNKGDQT